LKNKYRFLLIDNIKRKVCQDLFSPFFVLPLEKQCPGFFWNKEKGPTIRIRVDFLDFDKSWLDRSPISATGRASTERQPEDRK
jgi:hypothetical protein